MSKRECVIALLIVTFLGSCRVLDGHYRLSNSKRIVNLETFRDDNGNRTLLDTNAIYVSMIIENKTDTFYHFTRYFGNGRAYQSCNIRKYPPCEPLEEFPSREVCDNLDGGTKYYYTITKQGKLKEELYLNFGDGYNYYYSNIYEDKVVCYKTKFAGLGGASSSLNFTYYKVPMKLENFTTDW